MIYTFKSKASADLIMLEPAGNRVVAVLGKEGKKGIITFAECASAIAKLEAAIAEQENARAEQEAERQEPSHGGEASLGHVNVA